MLCIILQAPSLSLVMIDENFPCGLVNSDTQTCAQAGDTCLHLAARQGKPSLIPALHARGGKTLVLKENEVIGRRVHLFIPCHFLVFHARD
jgi:hypothetical protein